MFKKSKKILSFLIIISMFFMNNLVVYASEDDGKINIESSVIMQDERTAKVELSIVANEYTITTISKYDIVLVLDNSSSMSERDVYGKDGTKVTRREGMKDAAKFFVSELLNIPSADIRIGLVTFGTDVSTNDWKDLSSNETEINTYINNISAISNEGTNLQAGIEKANELLYKDDNGAQKTLIIFSDGEPTYFNYMEEHVGGESIKRRGGRGSSDASVTVCYKYDGTRCVNEVRTKPSTVAKNTLDTLKEGHETHVFTIGLGSEAQESLSKINVASKPGEIPIYKNFSTSHEDEQEIINIFDNITDETVDIIGREGVLTDIISKEFTLTDESISSLEEKGIDIVDNPDGTTTLTWNIGSVGSVFNYILSYEVKVKDEYYGSIYVNEESYLDVTVEDNNPYYNDLNEKTLKLNYERKLVNIPMITNDDNYSGYSGEIIEGESVLSNDNNSSKKTDGDNVEVTDEIVINTDGNVQKIEDNKYEISKNNKKQGILVMNSDGSFTFTQESDNVDDIIFRYYVESTITSNNEVENVRSNDSIVIINVNERSPEPTPDVKPDDKINPNTGDNILLFITMLGISIIGLSGIMFYNKKRI